MTRRRLRHTEAQRHRGRLSPTDGDQDPGPTSFLRTSTRVVTSENKNSPASTATVPVATSPPSPPSPSVAPGPMARAPAPPAPGIASECRPMRVGTSPSADTDRPFRSSIRPPLPPRPPRAPRPIAPPPPPPAPGALPPSPPRCTAALFIATSTLEKEATSASVAIA